MPIIWDLGTQRQDVQQGLPESSNARWEAVSKRKEQSDRGTYLLLICGLHRSTHPCSETTQHSPNTHIHTHVQNGNLTETCQSPVPYCFVSSLRLREDNSFIPGIMQQLTLCLECFSYRITIPTLWMIAVLFYWKCLIWVFSRRDIDWLLLWLTHFNADIKCQHLWKLIVRVLSFTTLKGNASSQY